jgi:hypothetical protein
MVIYSKRIGDYLIELTRLPPGPWKFRVEQTLMHGAVPVTSQWARLYKIRFSAQAAYLSAASTLEHAHANA